MRRRTFLAIPWGLAACGELARAEQPRQMIRVSTGNHLSMCPFYVGYELGYFAEAGFDIELIRDIGLAQSIPLLAGGKLDAGFTGCGASVVNAIARGARFRLVAAREKMTPGCGTAGTIFAARKAFPNGIRSMRELKGRRIGVGGAGPWGPFYLDVLAQHDEMSRSDFVVQMMLEAQAVAAVHAGGLDALLSFEGDLTPLLGFLGLVAGPSVAAVLPGLQFSYITFGQRLLDDRVETGARFLRAYFRGAHDYLRGVTPRFLDDYAKANNLDAAALRRVCRSTFEADGTIHLQDLRRLIAWMAAEGQCEANSDPATLVDSRFLEAAHRT